MKVPSCGDTSYVLVDRSSRIPLFGLDFLGLLDRGTNVLEIKPITLCNLHCDYCFVSAGDYNTNFKIESTYLLEWIQRAIELKNSHNIEIHFAPYGEILLYSDLEHLLLNLQTIPAISTISVQTNGLLLTPDKIDMLQKAGVHRLNVSLNSLNAKECAVYCGIQHYDLDHLLQMFDIILQSSMELLIAPVWFKGINDTGIMSIIKYVKEKESEGFTWPKLRLGIQNYLTYQTGRKIKRARMRDFHFFYTQLRLLEKEFHLKLKLGPQDFQIRKVQAISPPIRIGQLVQVEILCQGRWTDEYIAQYEPSWSVKVLTKKPLKQGQHIIVRLIRSNLHGNLLTAVYPPK